MSKIVCYFSSLRKLLLLLIFINPLLAIESKNNNKKFDFSSKQKIGIGVGFGAIAIIALYLYTIRENKDTDNNNNQKLKIKSQVETSSKTLPHHVNLHALVKSLDHTAINTLSTQENFKELCSAKNEDNKTPAEEIVDFKKDDLNSWKAGKIIETLIIEDEILLELFDHAYAQEAYAYMYTILSKINKKELEKSTPSNHDREENENQEKLTEIKNIFVESFKEKFKAMWDQRESIAINDRNTSFYDCLFGLIEGGVPLTKNKFEKLFRFVNNFKKKLNYQDILLCACVKRHGFDETADILIKVGTITDTSDIPAVKKLRARADAKTKFYTMCQKEQEKSEKEDGSFIFSIINDPLRKQNWINYVNDIKAGRIEKFKDPLLILDVHGKTALHYLIVKNSFDKEMFEVLFSKNDENKILWHENIAALDNNGNTFLHLCTSAGMLKEILEFFKEYPDNIRALLQKINNEQTILEIYFKNMTFSNYHNKSYFLYVLLSYDVPFNENIWKKCPISLDDLVSLIKNFKDKKNLKEEQKKELLGYFKYNLQENIKHLYTNDQLSSDAASLINALSENIPTEHRNDFFDLLINTSTDTKEICDVKIKLIIECLIRKNKNYLPNTKFYEQYTQKNKVDLVQYALEKKSLNSLKTLVTFFIEDNENELFSSLPNIEKKLLDKNDEFYQKAYMVILNHLKKVDEKIINSMKNLILKHQDPVNNSTFFADLLKLAKTKKIFYQVYPECNLVALHKTIQNSYSIFHNSVKDFIREELLFFIKNEDSLFNQDSIKEFIISTNNIEYVKFDKDQNILHIAILKNNMDFIELLLEEKNNKSNRYAITSFIKQDSHKKTPLDYAQDIQIFIKILPHVDREMITTAFNTFIQNFANKVAEIFDLKTDFFVSFKNPTHAALFWQMIYQSGKDQEILKKYCARYVEYADEDAMLLLLERYSEQDKEILDAFNTKKDIIFKVNVIKKSVNKKSPIFSNLLRRTTLVQEVINYKDGKEECFNSYSDFMYFILTKKGNAEEFFEVCKEEIKKEGANFVEKNMQELITNGWITIITEVLKDAENFPISEDQKITYLDEAIEEKNFNIAALFFDVCNIHHIAKALESNKPEAENFVLKYTEKIKQPEEGKEEQQKIVIVANKSEEHKKFTKEIRNYKDNKNQNLLHLYKIPLSKEENKKGILLLSLIKDFSINLLALKSHDYKKRSIPAIVSLCLNKDYKDFIDDFFVKELTERFEKTGDINTMKFKMQKKGWGMFDRGDKKEKFFILSTICRLPKTVTWLFEKNAIPYVEKDSKKTPTDPLCALFYWGLMIVDRNTQTSNKSDPMLESLYRNAAKNGKKDSVSDPVWKQTPYDYAVLWDDKIDKERGTWHGYYLRDKLEENEKLLQ